MQALRGNRKALFASLVLAAMILLASQNSPAQPPNAAPQRIDVDGTVEVLIADDFANKKSETHYHVRTAKGERLEMRFEKGKEPSQLVTGAHIKIRGAPKNSDGSLMLAYSSSGTSGTTVTFPDNTTPEPSVGWTFGAKKPAVILIQFSNVTTPPGTDPATVHNVFRTASDHYRENSLGQTWLTGVLNPSDAVDVYGYFTIAEPNTRCDVTAILTQGEQAALTAGVDLSLYDRKVYAFGSHNSNCPWGGSAVVGLGNSLINGPGNMRWDVVAHELGHNFGLRHAHSQNCSSSGCSVVEYGDLFDVMGNSTQGGHFNASQKRKLGWLDYNISPNIKAITESGSYFIGPYEENNSDPKGLKIYTGDASGKWYYAEYRQWIGFDSNLTYTGVILHTNLGPTAPNGQYTAGTDSRLIDIDPVSTGVDWVLSPGQTYTDAAAGITIGVTSQDNTGASVGVTVTCTLKNPTVTLPVGQPIPPGGGSVSYAIKIANNSSAGCGKTRFNLTTNAAPNGWTVSLSEPSVLLNPGAVKNLILTVGASSSVATNAYITTVVTATNNANSGYSGSDSVLTQVRN